MIEQVYNCVKKSVYYLIQIHIFHDLKKYDITCFFLSRGSIGNNLYKYYR